MLTKLARVQFPELFFGFVSPIGADLTPTINLYRQYFRHEGYRVVEIKVTSLFERFSPYIPPKITLQRTPAYERFKSYIAYGDQLREQTKDNATLAAATIRRIMRKRAALPDDGSAPYEKTVYLLYQFKRKEEVDLLRAVYGRLFFQVSAYSRKGARIDKLARMFARSAGSGPSDNFKEMAGEIVKQDADEAGIAYGQRVSKIFHDADFIINMDLPEYPIERQIMRFVELLFSSNHFSPTKIEYGMYASKICCDAFLGLISPSRCGDFFATR